MQVNRVEMYASWRLKFDGTENASKGVESLTKSNTKIMRKRLEQSVTLRYDARHVSTPEDEDAEDSVLN